VGVFSAALSNDVTRVSTVKL